MRVPSTDGVSLAVHEFGGRGRPLLFSHATGFHGYCYLPIADRLDDRFESFAVDYRGHGSSPKPNNWEPDQPVDWHGYGDDAVAVARSLAPDGGLIGFGHSMGGAALLMAAHREPGLFDLIIAYEPIVFPKPEHPAGDEESGLVVGARKRRPSFESFAAARENYASKPPFSAVDPDVLRLYVAHGFGPAPEGVRLKCDPVYESQTFAGGGSHRTFDVLPEIETPVVVIASGDGQGPALIAPQIAEQLPHARLIEDADADHFEPFTDPGGMAALIAGLVADPGVS